MCALTAETKATEHVRTETTCCLICTTSDSCVWLKGVTTVRLKVICNTCTTETLLQETPGAASISPDEGVESITTIVSEADTKASTSTGNFTVSCINRLTQLLLVHVHNFSATSSCIHRTISTCHLAEHHHWPAKSIRPACTPWRVKRPTPKSTSRQCAEPCRIAPFMPEVLRHLNTYSHCKATAWIEGISTTSVQAQPCNMTVIIQRPNRPGVGIALNVAIKGYEA